MCIPKLSDLYFKVFGFVSHIQHVNLRIVNLRIVGQEETSKPSQTTSCSSLQLSARICTADPACQLKDSQPEDSRLEESRSRQDFKVFPGNPLGRERKTRWFQDLCIENGSRQGHNMGLTGLFVPSPLDSGTSLQPSPPKQATFCFSRETFPLSSELGTYTKVSTRLWYWLSD